MVAVPEAVVAVTTSVAPFDAVVGVPLRTPVELIARPGTPLTAHPVTVPPTPANCVLGYGVPTVPSEMLAGVMLVSPLLPRAGVPVTVPGVPPPIGVATLAGSVMVMLLIAWLVVDCDRVVAGMFAVTVYQTMDASDGTVNEVVWPSWS
jgi:hypothetical protein